MDEPQTLRTTVLPYGRQSIDETDLASVAEVLESGWLTTGPMVSRFEGAIAEACGSREAVVVSSGTAGLHAAMRAIGIGAGDEVIVPAITFAATANAVVYEGATPIFADTATDTLLIDLDDVERKVSPRTKAVVAVDYAGQTCDYDGLRRIADRHDLALVADACHSLGGSYKGRPVGSLADLSVFSFHPVKAIATGEGGAITTDDPQVAARMRRFRNHGISSDHRERTSRGGHAYDMVELGWNYRLSDIQCALGLNQLKKLPDLIARRQTLASTYDKAISGMDSVSPLKTFTDREHAYHLYTVTLNTLELGIMRDAAFEVLRAGRIGVNVHYRPVHLHSFYRKNYGTAPGLCPKAESAYENILTLPLFPDMADKDISDVICTIRNLRNAT